MPELKAVFYGRFSSKMQTENSIEGQRRVVEAYAQREGINIVGEYVDRAKSGKNAKRDSFQQMIEDIENHTIDINMVVVYKLDRFARNEELHRDYEKILNRNGVFLISATEPVNEKELAAKIIKSLTLAINEEEVKKISQNVARGKKEIAYKGLWCGGTPPLGYDVGRDTQTLIINEKEAKSVKLAFKLRAQGFSYSYIIEQLNRRGYKTKLGNTDAKVAVEEVFSAEVTRYFDKNIEELRAILDNTMKSYNARKAGDKARNAILKQLNDVDTRSKLASCSSKKMEECEIYIVEGDSAGGTVKTARNRKLNSIFRRSLTGDGCTP